MRGWGATGRRAANSLAAVSIVLGAGVVGVLAISSGATEVSAATTSVSNPPNGSNDATSPTAPTNSQLLNFAPGQGGTAGGSAIQGTPDPTPAPGPYATTTTVSLLGSPARAPVPVNGTIPYGEALTVVATVDEAGGQPVTAGTVAFSENGASVEPEGTSSAICRAVPVVQGTASCALSALAASPTPYQFGASYTPAAQGSLTPSSVLPGQEAGVTVTQGSTTISLSGGPDPLSAGNVRLTALVTDASSGSNLPPTGSVAFQQGGVSLTCEQKDPVLSEASSSSSSESCDVPAPNATTTYAATYTPADGNDFTAAGPASASVTPGPAPGSTAAVYAAPAAAPVSHAALASHAAPALTADVNSDPACSAAFQTLWDASSST